MSYTFTPIATIRSPYREKFSAPRQPGLAPNVRARVELHPDYSSPEAVRELEGFSHIWLIFVFHLSYGQGWKPTVRPPRLGGNRRVGVFACRSPFRPNPVGLSAVRLLSIDCSAGKVSLNVEGADLIDGTPILDIKPYLPYTDGIAGAKGGFADRAPGPSLQVEFSLQAEEQLHSFRTINPQLETLIRETLSLDPRPAYRRDGDGHEYGVLLDRFNIRWKVERERAIIERITLVD